MPPRSERNPGTRASTMSWKPHRPRSFERPIAASASESKAPAPGAAQSRRTRASEAGRMRTPLEPSEAILARPRRARKVTDSGSPATHRAQVGVVQEALHARLGVARELHEAHPGAVARPVLDLHDAAHLALEAHRLGEGGHVEEEAQHVADLVVL